MSRAEVAVTCLINNDEAHSLRFVDSFTSIPGCHLILFLDDPGHLDYFEQPPENLTLVCCSEDYWHEQLGRQPRDMPEKQHTNIRRGADIARALGCTWAVSVDSDELISNLAELIPRLDRLGEGYDLLRLQPAELVHTRDTAFSTSPFSGHLFKRLLGDRELFRRLPGLPPRLILRLLSIRRLTRFMFFGHPNGKTLFRLSAPITRYKQHKQFSDERKLSLRVLPARYVILHHDAMNYETWRFKWWRRIHGTTKATAISEQRKRQTRKIARALQDDSGIAAQKLFESWYVFEAGDIAALKKSDLLFDLNDSAEHRIS